MPITFNGLFRKLEKEKMSVYRLKTDKVVGTATLDKLRKGEGNIDTRSIERLCRYFDCQPGELMESVKDEHGAED